MTVHITQYPNAEWARFDVLNSTGGLGRTRLSRFGHTFYQQGLDFYWSSGDRLIQLDCRCTQPLFKGEHYPPPVIDEFLQAYFAKYPATCDRAARLFSEIDNDQSPRVDPSEPAELVEDEAR